MVAWRMPGIALAIMIPDKVLRRRQGRVRAVSNNSTANIAGTGTDTGAKCALIAVSGTDGPVSITDYLWMDW